jgi:hypothetical protein
VVVVDGVLADDKVDVLGCSVIATDVEADVLGCPMVISDGEIIETGTSLNSLLLLNGSS